VTRSPHGTWNEQGSRLILSGLSPDLESRTHPNLFHSRRLLPSSDAARNPSRDPASPSNSWQNGLQHSCCMAVPTCPGCYRVEPRCETADHHRLASSPVLSSLLEHPELDIPQDSAQLQGLVTSLDCAGARRELGEPWRQASPCVGGATGHDAYFPSSDSEKGLQFIQSVLTSFYHSSQASPLLHPGASPPRPTNESTTKKPRDHP
jgi:hypothetical protein